MRNQQNARLGFAGIAGTADYADEFGFALAAGDFDNDGWPDVFVACDSTPSLFFRNQHDGTFQEDGVRSGFADDAAWRGHPFVDGGLSLGTLKEEA